MVQATLTDRQENTVTISITIPADAVDKKLNGIYAQLANNQKIKGFRQGKAPRDIIKSMFGTEGIHAQALQDLLPDAYEEAVVQLELTPTSEPDFDEMPTLEENKDLVLTLKVDVLPQIALGDYSFVNIDLEKYAPPTDEDVADAMLGMRKRLAAFEVVDRPCKENDRVNVDYTITLVDIAGKEPEKEYDRHEKLNLIIGDKEILPDIENNIIGLKTGETKKFVVKYPENYQNQEIAGKSASVEITLHEVAERTLPVIDAEFLKKVGGFKDEEEFKKDLIGRMEAYKKQTFEEAARNLAVEQILLQTHFNVPEKLIDEEIEVRMQELKDMLAQRGKSFEEALAEHNDSEEEYLKREHVNAATEIKRRIIFGEIFTKENMNIAPEEVALALTNYARSNGLSRSETKKLAKDRNQIAQLRLALRNMKVASLLASRAKFKDEWADGAQPAAEQPAETQPEGETKA